MDHICQRCGELIAGNAYRVTSEEEGITLLDMVVCSLEAKRLRLHAEEIHFRSKQASARNRGSHRPRLGILISTPEALHEGSPVLLNVVG